MATEKHSAGRSSAAATPFFQLHAGYSINADATLAQLVHDCKCLMESGVEVFEEGYENLRAHEWAGLYVLRQASAVLAEIERRLPANA